jgi:hypothetical protein
MPGQKHKYLDEKDIDKKRNTLTNIDILGETQKQLGKKINS